jgi:hypothetical protein
MPNARRFPPPWTIGEKTTPALLSATITARARLRFYFEQERSRRTASNLLTRDEARWIAANIAKLPGLLAR